MPDSNEEGSPPLGTLTEPPATNNAKPPVIKNSAGVDVSDAIPDRVTIEDVDRKCKEVYTETEKTKAWTDVAKTIETYSDKIIERWIKEIDTNLVFAGLFSAILTAFNVPAYALLNPPDPSIALLQQISSKLDSFSINQSFINSTQPSNIDSPNADTEPDTLLWAVWLNGFWFSGLILSLTSAALGLLSKQWLNEYSSGVSETSRHAARVRQYRLENLKAWHVEAVVDSIPVLLMLSLVCFLAGLLIFLWNLHHTVAAIASALVGLLAIFTIVVTFLPLWKPRCAYLSPQIRMIYHIWQPERLKYWMRTAWALMPFCCGAPRDSNSTVDEHKETWQRRERSYIHQNKHQLDMNTLDEAYKITLHPATLSAVTVCLMDFGPRDVIDYFQWLHRSAKEHFRVQEEGHLAIIGQQQMLWLRVLLSVSLMHEESEPLLGADEVTALGFYFESGSWSTTMQAADGKWAASALDALTEYLGREGTTESTRKLIGPDRLRTEREKLIGRATSGTPKPLMTVVQQVISGAYRQVRLPEQKYRAEASSDQTEATGSNHLRSVWHQFLEYSSRALALHIHVDDLETVRAYTPDILTKLTYALLELFTPDGKMRTTIEWTYLDAVMQKLRDLDDVSVEECIPDELVPKILDLVEILATVADDCDNHWMQRTQLSASTIKGSMARVKCKPAATWARDQVLRCQHFVDLANPDENRAALWVYLQRVPFFLECVNRASTSSSLPAKDLKAVYAQMQDVLTDLTSILLRLFTSGRAQIIESTHLDDVMRELCDLHDASVEEGIPDELVPKFLDLAEKLATAADYRDKRRVESIQRSALGLKASIARVKCKLAAAWASRKVHLQQKPVTPLGEARVVHTTYLRSVDYFLECVNRASTSSSLPVNDLAIVRAYAPEILTKLTHALLEQLTAEGEMRTTIEWTYLDAVMQKLRDLDDASVEECIPDELVRRILDLAEKLAVIGDYYKNDWVDKIQLSASTLKRNTSRVKCQPAAAWACHKVHLQQKPVASPNPDEASIAQCTAYLRSVDYFLECANHASTLSAVPANDLETIRANTQDILADLTRILLELFETDQARKTIEWTYLDDVMQKLGDLDDAFVKGCIPDELAPKFSELAEKLAWVVDNYDNDWVGQIQRSAFKFKANIDRSKYGKPAATWAYDEVCRRQKDLKEVASNEAMNVHRRYLQRVDYFLECVNRSSTSSSLPAKDLKTVYGHTQEVLTDLIHILLELFETGQAWTTIEWTYLDDVMQKLGDLDDASVKGCIPDELALKFSELAEKLAWVIDDYDNGWVSQVQRSTFTLQANIDHVKSHKPAATWAYEKVLWQQHLLDGVTQDQARSAYRRYLQRVDYFLEYVNGASTSPGILAQDTTKTVYAQTQRVLADLTSILLELFVADRARTTIETTYLDDVMRKLRNLDDASVEEGISDELVPKILDLAEKLVTTAVYHDNAWVHVIQDSAGKLKKNIDRVKCKPAATWAYHQVHLRCNPGAAPDKARAALTSYLHRVDCFLERVDCAWTSSDDPAQSDLEIVGVHMRNVITRLTHTLLELFSRNQAQEVIESKYLRDVMRHLGDLDDNRVQRYIPDTLVPEILNLADKLATTAGYHDNNWVDVIQDYARKLKKNIDRVKCKPDTTRPSPETLVPALLVLLATEPASPTGAMASSRSLAHSAVQNGGPSGTARGSGGGSQGGSGGAARSGGTLP